MIGALLIGLLLSVQGGDSLNGRERFGLDPYADRGALAYVRPFMVRPLAPGWRLFYDQGLPPGLRPLRYRSFSLEDPLTREPLPELIPPDAPLLRAHPVFGYQWGDRAPVPEPLTTLLYQQRLGGGEALQAVHEQRLYGPSRIFFRYGLGSEPSRWPGQTARSRTLEGALAAEAGDWRWELRYLSDSRLGRSNEGLLLEYPPRWEEFMRDPVWVAPEGRLWHLRWQAWQIQGRRAGTFFSLAHQRYAYGFDTLSERRVSSWALRARFLRKHGELEGTVRLQRARDPAWSGLRQAPALELMALDTLRKGLWGGVRLQWEPGVGGVSVAGLGVYRDGLSLQALAGWIGPSWWERFARNRHRGALILHAGVRYRTSGLQLAPFLSYTGQSRWLEAGFELDVSACLGPWTLRLQALLEDRIGAPRELPLLQAHLRVGRDFTRGEWGFRLEGVLLFQSPGVRISLPLSTLTRTLSSGPRTPPGLWANARLFARYKRAWPFVALDNVIEGLLPGAPPIPTAYRPLESRQLRWGVIWELAY
nr:MAG: hypothetical protein KatS3mg041_0755 [Bacteroidota bacterium]